MISHHHKVLFVHIPKTAGQSIVTCFLTDLGLNWNERIALGMTKNNPESANPSSLAHFKAKDYLKYRILTEEMFESYYKFSIIRNPYSRVVSMYKFLGFSVLVPFNTFVKDYLSKKIWKRDYWIVGPQYEFLIDDDGNLMVDDVIKFEELKMGFKKIVKRSNLETDELPTVNKSGNKIKTKKRVKGIRKNNPELMDKKYKFKVKSSSDYANIYDQESLDIVNELYALDFENLDYDKISNL